MVKFTALNLNEAIQEAVKISGLGERLNERTKTYGKGMKRKLFIARTLITKPKMASIDEPASGLDVIAAYNIRNIIKTYVKQNDVTVLLSSHNMLEVPLRPHI